MTVDPKGNGGDHSGNCLQYEQITLPSKNTLLPLPPFLLTPSHPVTGR